MSSIGSTLNSLNQSLLTEVSSYLGTSKTSTSASTAQTTASSSSSADSVSFSQVGQLFQELKQLQTSNPADFKQVMTDAANKLEAAAQQSSDPSQTSFLSNLATKFQNAAHTGNLSALQSQSSSGSSGTYTAHGHHHHHGESSSDSSTSQTGGDAQSLLSELLGTNQSTSSSTTNNTSTESLLSGILGSSL